MNNNIKYLTWIYIIPEIIIVKGNDLNVIIRIPTWMFFSESAINVETIGNLDADDR